MRARYGELSPAHRRVAQYLLADGRRAALVPAADVAWTLQLSEATVVRFAKALGFEGYPALRQQLRERFLTYATSLDRLAATSDERARDRTDVLARVLADDADSILRTLALVPQGTFDAVVNGIVAARTVYVVGFRGSAGIALILGMGLRIFLPETRVVATNVGDTAEQLLSLRAGDCVIVVSYLRYSGQTLETLRYARDAGARTVALTDSPTSPVARLADLVLLARAATPRVMASYAPAASVASALIEAVAVKRGRRAHRSLRQAETLWGRFQVHARDDD
ncbi:MurR/RpiR family transcriptional regulator [soil metagenome]